MSLVRSLEVTSKELFIRGHLLVIIIQKLTLCYINMYKVVFCEVNSRKRKILEECLESWATNQVVHGPIKSWFMDCQSSTGSWTANQVLVHGLPIKHWFMDCQSSLGSWAANQVLVHGLPIKSWVFSYLVSYTICTSYVHFCF